MSTILSINQTELIIGEIIQVHIADEFLHDDGYIDIEQAGTVAVSSLDSYHLTTLLSQSAYAKPSLPTVKLNRKP